MKTKMAFWGVVGLALAGCGGAGGGGDEGEFVLSDGVLTGVELPTGSSLAEFPAEVQTLITELPPTNMRHHHLEGSGSL